MRRWWGAFGCQGGRVTALPAGCRSHSLLTLASKNPHGPRGTSEYSHPWSPWTALWGGGAEAPLRRPVREPGLPSVLQQGGRLLFGGTLVTGGVVPELGRCLDEGLK